MQCYVSVYHPGSWLLDHRICPAPTCERHTSLPAFVRCINFLHQSSLEMPSELLHAPPLYTVVGAYRLLTDPSIRGPVLDKVKHASIRGIIVGLIYAVVSWKPLDWFIRRFLVGGQWSLFGFRKVKEVVEGHSDGKVSFRGVELDIVLCMSRASLIVFCGLIFRYAPFDSITANIIYPEILHIQKPQISSIKSIRFNRGFTS